MDFNKLFGVFELLKNRYPGTRFAVEYFECGESEYSCSVYHDFAQADNEFYEAFDALMASAFPEGESVGFVYGTSFHLSLRVYDDFAGPRFANLSLENFK